jgi:hypothetical protein
MASSIATHRDYDDARMPIKDVVNSDTWDPLWRTSIANWKGTPAESDYLLESGPSEGRKGDGRFNDSQRETSRRRNNRQPVDEV